MNTPIGRFPTAAEGAVSVMIRPESVRIVDDPQGPGVIVDREFFGHDQLYTVRLDTGEVLRARTGPTPILQRTERVRLEVDNVIAFPD